MTLQLPPICRGRTVDNWRTVWHCELEPHTHGLCRYGVMQWVTPGIGDRPAIRLRNTPLESFQWTGDLDAVPEWVDAVRVEPLFDSLQIRVPTPTGPQPRHLLSREWAVRWSDGQVSLHRADEYEAMYEAARA